jgi:hypothetical protein
LNQNRNNNRRRGRGSNRGQGGGNQSNRIDSRARGNAPQLLEKYKKLAHDASLNDDRVQTEYYLQFADHYFRVIADNKAQKDEQRAKREGGRDHDSDDGSDGDDRNQDRNEERNQKREDRSEGGNKGRKPRPRRGNDADDAPKAEGAPGVEGDEAGEDENNPFVAEAKPKAKRTRRKSADGDEKKQAAQDGLDPDSLPPSISRGDEESVEKDNGQDEPKPRTRRRRKSSTDSNGEDGSEGTLQAVN